MAIVEDMFDYPLVELNLITVRKNSMSDNFVRDKLIGFFEADVLLLYENNPHKRVKLTRASKN